MRRAALLVLIAFIAAPAAAEVTRESPLVEDTGHTLSKGEWKLGITTSSYGITDRLQVDSWLLLDLAVLNAGLKYKIVDAPNLALSANIWAGGSAVLLLAKIGLVYGGAKLDATMPLADELALNLTGGWQMWQVSSVGEASSLLSTGRLSWFTVKAGLQWVYSPTHIFFVSVGTPTSWIATLGGGTQDFDALDFTTGLVGYQFSKGVFNVRLDVGWGPSLLGRGPTAAFDLYFRF